jgi:hypothetical protein
MRCGLSIKRNGLDEALELVRRARHRAGWRTGKWRDAEAPLVRLFAASAAVFGSIFDTSSAYRSQCSALRVVPLDRLAVRQGDGKGQVVCNGRGPVEPQGTRPPKAAFPSCPISPNLRQHPPIATASCRPDPQFASTATLVEPWRPPLGSLKRRKTRLVAGAKGIAPVAWRKTEKVGDAPAA